MQPPPIPFSGRRPPLPPSASEFSGIILRLSSSSLYAYAPLPLRRRPFPSGGDAAISSSISGAPFFPDISILDSFSSFLLYDSPSSFPPFLFHIYDLFTRRHIPISFPFLSTPLSAAFLLLRRNRLHFKLVVVCRKSRLAAAMFTEHQKQSAGPAPLALHVYASDSGRWSQAEFRSPFVSRLRLNRRKPVHGGDGKTVYLDLTERYLVRFDGDDDKAEALPKLVSLWEMEGKAMDIGTRFGECKGKLQCAKFNPVYGRIEVYEWRGRRWEVAATGKNGFLGRRVVGIHPEREGVVFLRSGEERGVKDGIFMYDLVGDVEWVVMADGCGGEGCLTAATEVLEAAVEGGRRWRRGCGRLHPHENVEGPEGDVFVVRGFPAGF